MKLISIVYLLSILSLALNAQQDLGAFLPEARQAYREHVAIKMNDRFIKNETDPRQECRLPQDAKGIITISRLQCQSSRQESIHNLSFMVAIHNQRTGTKWSYTKEPVQEVSLEYIIAKCEPGDKIVFMLVDQGYALAENELELAWEC